MFIYCHIGLSLIVSSSLCAKKKKKKQKDKKNKKTKKQKTKKTKKKEKKKQKEEKKKKKKRRKKKYMNKCARICIQYKYSLSSYVDL